MQREIERDKRDNPGQWVTQNLKLVSLNGSFFFLFNFGNTLTNHHRRLGEQTPKNKFCIITF